MREIYLDNAATTRTSRTAAQKCLELLTEKYGNPSSLHMKGMEAEKEIERARKTIAASLAVDCSEIYFTSGGTEANNIAIRGSLDALRRRGNRIVTTAIEHSSVLDTCISFEKQGFEVVRIKPDYSGRICEKDVFEAINEKTILVSMMLINNEIGSQLPVQAGKRAIIQKSAPGYMHVDAVQAFGKIDVKPKKLGADLLTVSSHKIHGPKGCGALFVSKGVRILPPFTGGEQEKRVRPGTQATSVIAAFGVAAEEMSARDHNIIKSLNIYAREKLSEIEGIVINSPDDASEYIISCSVPFIRSETMLHFLSQRNIYISSGSACAAGKPSHVLTAMGLKKEVADGTLRISFSGENTYDDIDELVRGIKDGIKTLARSRR